MSYPSFALRSTFQSDRWKMSVSVHEAHHKMFIVLTTEGCAYDFVADSCIVAHQSSRRQVAYVPNRLKRPIFLSLPIRDKCS